MPDRYPRTRKREQPSPRPISYITIQVSRLEAAMIKKLRDYDFGQFTIHKSKGQPTRIIIGGSEILEPEDGMELAENVVE